MSSSDEVVSAPPPVSRSNTEVEQQMGEAHRHYIMGRFDQAKEILEKVITKEPKSPDPYHLLGIISEDSKEPERAVSFFYLAAKTTHNDPELWTKVAYMYKDLEHYKQACYCFSRAVKNKGGLDVDLMKEQ